MLIFLFVIQTFDLIEYNMKSLINMLGGNICSNWNINSNAKNKSGKENTTYLKKQLKSKCDKWLLECSTCKIVIQRKCMYEHQKTPTCKYNGLL